MTDYETLKSRVDTDDGTYWWALTEIERLREMLIEARDDATRFGRLMQKCVIALREIAEGDRPDNDEQFCVGYWGATARAALGEGKE